MRGRGGGVDSARRKRAIAMGLATDYAGANLRGAEVSRSRGAC